MESFVKHSSNDIPDRFEWAIEVMKIQPSDSVLEIGCGTGILAEQICKTLSGGSFTAVDRSEEMITKAMKRNERFIISGIASFTPAEFTKARFPHHAYDSIVAFNVNFFWKKVDAELIMIKRILKPAGRLFVFHQPPSSADTVDLKMAREKLSENGFHVVKTKSKPFHPATAYCMIAAIA